MLNFLALCLAFQAAAYTHENFSACPVNDDSPVVTDQDGTMKYLGIPSAAYAQVSGTPVELDSALVTGVEDGSLTKYLGIPFAQAPRFDLPQPITSYTGNITADAYGPACPQQLIPDLSDSDRYEGPESEDCLSINIIKPSLSDPSVKLPVVVCFFGGGFEFGGSSQYDEWGKELVLLSVQLNKPVIYVSMNYRVSAYGFLASQEVADECLGACMINELLYVGSKSISIHLAVMPPKLLSGAYLLVLCQLRFRCSRLAEGPRICSVVSSCTLGFHFPLVRLKMDRYTTTPS